MPPPVAIILMPSAPSTSIRWRIAERMPSIPSTSPLSQLQWPRFTVTGLPETMSRGPTAAPRLSASRIAKPVVLREPQSKAVVTPARTIRSVLTRPRATSWSSDSLAIVPSGSTSPAKVTWTWASIRPGRAVASGKESCRVSSGVLTRFAGPTSTILSSTTRIAASSIGAASVPSIRCPTAIRIEGGPRRLTAVLTGPPGWYVPRSRSLIVPQRTLGRSRAGGYTQRHDVRHGAPRRRGCGSSTSGPTR